MLLQFSRRLMPRRIVPFALRCHGTAQGPPGNDENPVRFIFEDSKGGLIKEARARIGETILEVAHNNDVDLEGACEQSLACSTCHVILEEEIFDNLDYPCDEEEDMLDLAYGLTHTSRLGC